MSLKKRTQVQASLLFSSKLNSRERNELEIQRLTANMSVEELNTPEKIKAWIEKDD